MWKSEFGYDGQRRRRLREEFTWQNDNWVSTNLVRYCWQGKVVLQERHTLAGESSAAGVGQVVSYTRGRDLSGRLEGAGGIAGLLSRNEMALTGGSLVANYHSDRLGNITLLAFIDGSIAARYLYDAYGRELATAGFLWAANKYRFASQEVHEQSELVIYLYRLYSPSLQRWINRDPAGENGGINLYVACGNALIQMVDPDGRNPVVVAGAIIIVADGVAASMGLGLLACLADAKCAEEVRKAVAALVGEIAEGARAAYLAYCDGLHLSYSILEPKCKGCEFFERGKTIDIRIKRCANAGVNLCCNSLIVQKRLQLMVSGCDFVRADGGDWAGHIKALKERARAAEKCERQFMNNCVMPGLPNFLMEGWRP